MQQREARTRVSNSQVQLQRTPEQASKAYSVLNISRGGLCFESNDEYELNEVLHLNLLLNEKEIHSASGRVCYRNNNDEHLSYGLSFLDKFIDTDLLKDK